MDPSNDRDHPPAALQERFLRLCAEPSDINEHLGILWGLARQCNFIVEMGIRSGVSTTALLAAQPDRLHCIDLIPCPVIEELAPMRGRTILSCHWVDSREILIAGADFLHIDALHNYAYLSVVFRLHAPKVRRWIALHDTEVFWREGCDGGEGMGKAIDELVAGGDWRVWAKFPHNHGMTVLQRVK